LIEFFSRHTHKPVVRFRAWRLRASSPSVSPFPAIPTIPFDNCTIVNVSTISLRHRPGSECWRKRRVRSILAGFAPLSFFFTWKTRKSCRKSDALAGFRSKEEIHPWRYTCVTEAAQTFGSPRRQSRRFNRQFAFQRSSAKPVNSGSKYAAPNLVMLLSLRKSAPALRAPTRKCVLIPRRCGTSRFRFHS